MRHIKILLFLLTGLGIFFVYAFIQQAYIGKVVAGAPIHIQIEQGLAPEGVARLLEKEGIISSAFLYKIYGRFDRAYERPKAGEYDIRSQTSFQAIAKTLAKGPARREVQIRIIEGWSVNDIIDHLQKTEGIDPAVTASLVGQSVNKKSFDPALRSAFPFLDSLPTERSLEGYLFPDTYRVWADQLPDALIKKQLQEFQSRFADANISSDVAPLKTLDDVVILASLVQREVRDPQDMRIVAGIFLNRLKAGMRLQSDATVSYLTGSGNARSTPADLQIDSPYNSYRNAGLPPSPVGNPSEDALRAVLAPEKTNYYYFLTDRDGAVLYGRTFEEHQQNRIKAGY